MFKLDNHVRAGLYALSVFAGLFVLVLVAGNIVATQGIEHFLKKSAIARAQQWERHISRDSAMTRIMAEGRMNRELVAHLRKEARYYNISNFAFTGVNGRVIAQAGMSGQSGRVTASGAATAQAGAMGLEGGRSEAKDDSGTSATVAVHNGRGKTIGHLRVRMDMSGLRKSLRQSAHRVLLLALIALTIMAVAAWLAYHQISSDARRRIVRLRGEDHLTGLPTRQVFLARFGDKIDRAGEADFHLAYMHLDLDNFSKIVSTYGFDAADEILRAMARRLDDIAGEEGLICRLDGDAFAIVRRVDSPADALRMGERMLENVRKPVFWQERLFQVSASVGVATFPHDGKTRSRLERRAALACWAATSEGGGRLRFYDPGLEERHREREQLEKLLKGAVESGGFEMHFQPLVHLADGRLQGFESLIRMSGAEGMNISPEAFIGMAERLNLMDEVGVFALREGCRVAAEWPEHLSVAINLSPSQFRSGQLVDLVRETLAETGLAATRLEVEVTENLMLDDSPFIHEQLRKLQDMGVRIVLDDFGTGYSSLNYLWQFPFDKLKIDRAFVSAMGTSRQARSILRAMLVMARALNIPVVAEGIENEEQARWLRKLRCETGQGYYFGKPAPAKKIAALVLDDWRKRNAKETPAAERKIVPLRRA